jgi:UDPglucose 6-dehydrogenase
MLKLSILGSGPLANATAHCCAQHFEVVRVPAWDADVHWLCFDTPLKEGGAPDVEAVLTEIRGALRSTHVQHFALISSQLPVGTTARLQDEFSDWHFAYNPENIRHASAVEDFQNQARVVVGMAKIGRVELLRELFAPFTKKLIFTDITTAEFIKGATNVWLAANIALSNELGALCERAHGNPAAMASALLADPRLTPKLPGPPYSGGHLEREVFNLTLLAQNCSYEDELPLLTSIKASNDLEIDSK